MEILLSVDDGSDEQRRAMDELLALELLTHRDWVGIQYEASHHSKPTLQKLAIEVQLRMAEGRPRDDLSSRTR